MCEDFCQHIPPVADCNVLPVFDQLKEVSEEEVTKVIKGTNKYCSFNSVLQYVLKLCLNTLLPSVIKIINLSIASSIFPTKLKPTIVTLLLNEPSLNSEKLKN